MRDLLNYLGPQIINPEMPFYGQADCEGSARLKGKGFNPTFRKEMAMPAHKKVLELRGDQESKGGDQILPIPDKIQVPPDHSLQHSA